MKKILLLLNLFCLSLFADSSVWKVSKADNHIYIGGTIHVLSSEDYPLPLEFKEAYEKSKILVFETDLKQITNPKIQKIMQEKSVYSNGKTLKDYLEKDTLEVYKEYLKSKSMPIPMMLNLKPGIIMSILTINALNELGINKIGVDEFFEAKAIEDKKQLLYLEEIEEQITFFSNIGIGNENNFIRYTIEDMGNFKRDINMIRQAWKDGNVKDLEAKFITLLKEKFPKTYNEILVKRNNNWMPKIENMFKTKDVEYVLFGALHLVGEDGILHKLEKLGYKIEKL